MEWIISTAAVLAVVVVYTTGAARALDDKCPDLQGVLLLTWPFILVGLSFFVFAFKLAAFGA